VMVTPKVATFAGTRSGQRAAVPGATTNMPAYRQPHAQSARPETHAQAAPPVRGEARIDHRAAQPSAPPRHREAGIERRAPSGAAAPMARPEPHAYAPPRPEVHAQGAPRAQTNAASPAPRTEMHAQSTPRSEARAPVAPRPEMHAQNAPRMQARAGSPRSEPRGARPPNGQREEERGPR
jgi:hypothetical protein